MSYDYEAEHFTAQCRRDALRYPIRHIDEVAPRRIVSRDFATGSADNYDWTEFSSSGLPFLLQRQAE
jgi:hypothetical protein